MINLRASPRAATLLVGASILILAALMSTCFDAVLLDMVVADEVTYIPAATGAVSTTEYLVESHNGHRLIVPKLLQLGSIALAGGRLWAPRFCTLLALIVSTGLFLTLVRQVRGRIAACDVSIPLLFLGPQLAFTLIHTFDLQFVLHNTLLATALLLGFRSVGRSRWPSAWIGVALVALALSGIHGLLAAAVFAPFVAAYAFDWGDARALGTARWAAPALVGAQWLLFGWLSSWDSVRPSNASFAHRLSTALQFLTGAFGPAGVGSWPLSGLIVSAFVLVALGVLARLRTTTDDELGRRKLGLLIGAIVASLAVAAAVGWGRAGWGGNPVAGLARRFTALSARVFALLHVVLAMASSRSTGRRFGRVAQGASWALVGGLVLSLPAAVSHARAVTAWFRAVTHGFMADARRGAPVGALVDRYEAIYPYDRDRRALAFSLMCERGLGPFRSNGRGVACSVAPVTDRVVDASGSGTEFIETSIGALSNQVPGCDPRGPSCAPAIAAYCKTRGRELGFGPVETAAQSHRRRLCARAPCNADA